MEVPCDMLRQEFKSEFVKLTNWNSAESLNSLWKFLPAMINLAQKGLGQTLKMNSNDYHLWGGKKKDIHKGVCKNLAIVLTRLFSYEKTKINIYICSGF